MNVNKIKYHFSDIVMHIQSYHLNTGLLIRECLAKMLFSGPLVHFIYILIFILGLFSSFVSPIVSRDAAYLRRISWLKSISLNLLPSGMTKI